MILLRCLLCKYIPSSRGMSTDILIHHEAHVHVHNYLVPLFIYTLKSLDVFWYLVHGPSSPVMSTDVMCMYCIMSHVPHVLGCPKTHP